MTNTVVTTLFTATPDPQRPGTHFSADPSVVDRLASSLQGATLTVLTDQTPPADTDRVRWEHVDRTNQNPYVDRWAAVAGWVDRTDTGWVWAVDAGDVIMLRPPWGLMVPGVVYCGSEPEIVGLPWLANNHPSVRPFIADHHDWPLLNAGLVGADRRTFAGFAADMCAHDYGDDMTDMGAINQVGARWGHRLITGPTVHTRFRAEDHTNPHAWWAHK